MFHDVDPRTKRRAGAGILAAVSAVALIGVAAESRGGSSESDKAHALASKISTELYDTGFPKGVPVPGILNGTVQININTVGGVRQGQYKNPILLERIKNEPTKSADANFLDGTYIGIPGSNAAGQVVITPVQVHIGKNGDATTSVILDTEPSQDPNVPKFSYTDSSEAIFENGAAVYPSEVTNAPDELMGFDISGNGNFPSVEIVSDGMK
jgi:hypothetical protein